MNSILNKSFKYVPSRATDVKATFDRIRREQKEAQVREDAKVLPIKHPEHTKP